MRAVIANLRIPVSPRNRDTWSNERFTYPSVAVARARKHSHLIEENTRLRPLSRGKNPQGVHRGFLQNKMAAFPRWADRADALVLSLP